MHAPKLLPHLELRPVNLGGIEVSYNGPEALTFLDYSLGQVLKEDVSFFFDSSGVGIFGVSIESPNLNPLRLNLDRSSLDPT